MFFQFTLSNNNIQPQQSWKLETENEFANDEEDVFMKHKKYLDATTKVMKLADVEDKQLQRDRLREKKQARKRKLRGTNDGDEVCDYYVLLIYLNLLLGVGCHCGFGWQ